jgi:DNA invertase Pin-like site-specific DNA recombinase
MLKNRVAIYCRLSKEDDKKGESESIQNQKSMLLSYALKQEWEVVGIYADDNFSGTDSDRPEWLKMLAECETGNVDIVLCKTQSRFSRDMGVIEKYIHGKFIEWRIRFVSIVDNADSSSKGNKKARQILALTNEWYVEEISDNIRAVFKDKMHKGEYIATFAPYGYKKNNEVKNHLVIDDNTAPIVRQIYEWYLGGYGAQRITKMLNERGIPNPRKYQEMQGNRKTCIYNDTDVALWNNYTVRDILHNQTYCGDTVQHRTEKVSYKTSKNRRLPYSEWIIVEDTHAPIITRETFNRAQAIFSTHKRTDKTGQVHILAGKCFCHYCGALLQRNNSRGKNEYLRCRHKYDLPQDRRCATPNVPLSFVVDYINGRLQEILREYAQDRTFTIKEKDNTVAVKQIEKLQGELTEVQKAITSLYFDKVKGVLSEEQFMMLNTEFGDRVLNIKRAIGKFEGEIESGEKCQDRQLTAHKAIRAFLADKVITRQLITDIVEKIIIGERNEGDEVIIDIMWAF